MNKKKPEPRVPQLVDMNSLYSVRLLVFIEQNPQSNKYVQVLFNDRQYKNVSLAVSKQFQKQKDHNCANPNCEGVGLVVSEQVHKLPDLQDIHSCTKDCKC